MSPAPACLALPSTCSVAFKEWRGVCEALASGRQSLILRKGGIAEDHGQFVPEHRAFWLYPTHVHERQQGLRGETAAPEPSDGDPGTVAIDTLAVVEHVAHLDDPGLLPALAPLHVWTEETVLRRFHYRAPGLWVLGVRVFRAGEPTRLAVAPEHAGCKSWVPLHQPLPTAGLQPVVADVAHARGLDHLRAVLDRQPPPGP